MKKVGYALLLAVMVFPLLAGCSANRKATSEILEERMRKPGGPLVAPGYPQLNNSEKGAGVGESPKGLGK